METFYNTTRESGETLKEYTEKAQTQDEKVLAFFRSRPGKYFTPFDIQKYVFDDRTPVTSCRRSLTNLTAKGLIYKSSVKEVEVYNRANYTWSLVITDPSGQTKIC